MKENTNLKGLITETAILNYVISQGYSVSLPFGDKNRYDQIWDINGKLLRIQIKTCHLRRTGGEAIEFNCYSSVNGKRCKYSKVEIDFFATYWNNQLYLIPVEECSIAKVLWFTPTNNQCKCLAKDYLFEEVIKKI